MVYVRKHHGPRRFASIAQTFAQGKKVQGDKEGIHRETERERPAIKVGGEVDERLDASKRLEQVGLVDGEGVARVDAAPLRRLLLQ